MIDETFARVYFGVSDPIGQRLRIGRTDFEIVGVVGAVKQTGLDRQAEPTLYCRERLLIVNPADTSSMSASAISVTTNVRIPESNNRRSSR
jgi:hypothetical protein